MDFLIFVGATALGIVLGGCGAYIYFHEKKAQ